MDSDESLLDLPTEVDAPEREPPYAEEPPPIPRSEAELTQLIADGLPHVNMIARTLRQKLGRLCDADELASVGRVALIETARSFDPTRAEFVPYVRKKLRWAMLDSVRRDTHGRWVSGRARGLRAVERVRESIVDGLPDLSLPEAAHARSLRSVLASQAAAMATSFAASLRTPAEHFVPSSVGGHASTAPPPPPVDPELLVVAPSTPEEQMASARWSAALDRALGLLPPRQREIVQRHYFDDERFDHIADSMGISKSWASRLHAQAMQLLADVLRDHR